VSEPREHDPGLAETGVALADGPRPGTRVGEYEIERELGRGGMGVVFAARHPMIGKRVAIKVLDAYFSRDKNLVRRFLDEARAVNRIGHPNIIDVFSFGQLPDGRQYFVMEFLEGETMANWLARGRPDPREAQRLLLQVCEALEAAHREGIIHRDLKPENLWIARPKHGEPFIKVLDFGIAKLVADEDVSNVTKTGTVMGTPQFMSPEQCTGRGVDHRTDIYALGVILFLIYCGALPFEGDSVAEILAAQLTRPPPKPSELVNLPATLENLILCCLDKKPANRPASAAELGLRLREIAQGGVAATALFAPVHHTGEPEAKAREGLARDEEDGGHKEMPRSRRRVSLLVLVAAALAGGAFAAWLTLRSGSPVPHATAPASSTVKTPAAAAPSAAGIAPVAGATPAPLVPAPAVQPPTVFPHEAVVPSSRPHSASAVARPAQGSSKPVTIPAESAKNKPSRAARQGLIQENPF
jgi:serine/threonine-protein kinase